VHLRVAWGVFRASWGVSGGVWVYFVAETAQVEQKSGREYDPASRASLASSTSAAYMRLRQPAPCNMAPCTTATL